MTTLEDDLKNNGFAFAMSNEGWKRANDWYETHECPGWDESVKRAEKMGIPSSIESAKNRYGCGGDHLHIGYFTSTIALPCLGAVCSKCHKVLLHLTESRGPV